MSAGAVPLCPKCHAPGWHFVAPRLGTPGYYACEREPTAPTPTRAEEAP